MSMSEKFIEIIPPKEFDFNECLVFLRRSEQELLHRIHKRSVYKALQINGETILLQMLEKNERIRIVFPLGAPSLDKNEQIECYIREWFDLDRDITPFYKMAERDPILRDLIQKYYGYRVIGIPDLFEAITWAIIGQQINLTFAYKLKKRLVKQFGNKITWEGIDYWLFPEPQRIATLQVADLREMQFTRRKAEYIIGVAKLINDGKISKNELLHKSYQELKKRLLTLRGVGNWTADYVIMRCFNRPNALPVADVGLQRALGRQLGLDRKSTTEEIKELAKEWGGWESYATFYLWRSSYD